MKNSSKSSYPGQVWTKPSFLLRYFSILSNITKTSISDYISVSYYVYLKQATSSAAKTFCQQEGGLPTLRKAVQAKKVSKKVFGSSWSEAIQEIRSETFKNNCKDMTSVLNSVCIRSLWGSDIMNRRLWHDALGFGSLKPGSIRLGSMSGAGNELMRALKTQIWKAHICHRFIAGTDCPNTTMPPPMGHWDAESLLQHFQRCSWP